MRESVPWFFSREGRDLVGWQREGYGGGRACSSWLQYTLRTYDFLDLFGVRGVKKAGAGRRIDWREREQNGRYASGGGPSMALLYRQCTFDETPGVMLLQGDSDWTLCGEGPLSFGLCLLPPLFLAGSHHPNSQQVYTRAKRYGNTHTSSPNKNIQVKRTDMAGVEPVE